MNWRIDKVRQLNLGAATPSVLDVAPALAGPTANTPVASLQQPWSCRAQTFPSLVFKARAFTSGLVLRRLNKYKSYKFLPQIRLQASTMMNENKQCQGAFSFGVRNVISNFFCLSILGRILYFFCWSQMLIKGLCSVKQATSKRRIYLYVPLS